MRRLVVASAILAALLTMPLGLAAADPISPNFTTNSARATAALEYLLAAQGPDGSIDGSIGETADFVIGAAAAGYDPATLHGCAGGTGALSFIATASDAAGADAGKTGKAILAVVAAGADPANFAGRDLPARLAALYHPATGAYGDGATFGQALAMLAVAASGNSVPAAATAWLASLQGGDGSWSYGSVAPAAGDGDTNSTAIALMALGAAGVHSADSAALTYLSSQQVSGGGFAYSTAWGATSDPDSDAVVLQALLAVGQDPEGPAWSQPSGNVLTDLRAMQGADGGFVYPGWGESAFVTSQVPAALMRVPYGAPVHPTAGLSVPPAACPSPSPSPTPSSASPTPRRTATPTPRPTARPTVRPTAPPASSQPAASPTAESTTPASASVVVGPSVVVAAATAAAGGAGGGPPAPTGSSGSSGDVPAPLVYALAAVVGLAAVACGGWLLSVWLGKR